MVKVPCSQEAYLVIANELCSASHHPRRYSASVPNQVSALWSSPGFSSAYHLPCKVTPDYGKHPTIDSTINPICFVFSPWKT